MPSFLQGRLLKKEAVEHARADENMMLGNRPAAMEHEARAMEYGVKADKKISKREKEAAGWHYTAQVEHTRAANAAAVGDHNRVTKHGWRAHQAEKRAAKLLGKNHVHAPYARHIPPPGMGMGPLGPTVVNVPGGPLFAKDMNAGYGAPMATAPMPGPGYYHRDDAGPSGVTVLPPVYVNENAEEVYPTETVDAGYDAYGESQHEESAVTGYTGEDYSYSQRPAGGEVSGYYPTSYQTDATGYDETGAGGVSYSSSGYTQPHVEEYFYDEYHTDENGNVIDEYHNTTQNTYYE